MLEIYCTLLKKGKIHWIHGNSWQQIERHQKKIVLLHIEKTLFLATAFSAKDNFLGFS